MAVGRCGFFLEGSAWFRFVAGLFWVVVSDSGSGGCG